MTQSVPEWQSHSAQSLPSQRPYHRASALNAARFKQIPSPEKLGVCVSGDQGISFKVQVVIMTSGNQTELARKEASLIAAIEKMLPDFARACRAHDTPVVIMHQDAFAADYQEKEYRLIGMAIKFAGICGKKSASTDEIGRL